MKNVSDVPYIYLLLVVNALLLTINVLYWYHIHRARKRDCSRKDCDVPKTRADYIRILQEEDSLRENALQESDRSYDMTDRRSRNDFDFNERLERTVIKNIGNPQYSVDMLCEDMHMERSGLYRHFKRSVGITPLEYIRRMRMQYEDGLLNQDKQDTQDK